MKNTKVRRRSLIAVLAATGIGLICWGVSAAPVVAHSSGIGIDTAVSSSTDVRSSGFDFELRYMTTSAAACEEMFKSTPPVGFSIILR